MDKVPYYNVLLDLLDTEETLTKCRTYFKSQTNNLIFFINAHCFNIAQQNSTYKAALNDAGILLNDGIGIKLGALLTGIRIKENMNGTDFVPKLLALARDEQMNVYLLGGEEGVAAKAGQNLKKRINGISIVGTRSGYFNFDHDTEILDDIINKKTDVLIVGMGVPRQELWLIKNKDRLKGVKISVAGGAVLDFISENVRRAPVWMQKSGTEWVFRLAQEPLRLFKRYFIGIPVFFMNIIKIKLS